MSAAVVESPWFGVMFNDALQRYNKRHCGSFLFTHNRGGCLRRIQQLHKACSICDIAAVQCISDSGTLTFLCCWELLLQWLATLGNEPAYLRWLHRAVINLCDGSCSIFCSCSCWRWQCFLPLSESTQLWPRSLYRGLGPPREQNVHMARWCASVPMCGGITEIPDLNCGVRQCCVHVLSVILLLFIISTRYPKTPPHKWFKGSGGIFSANMIWLRWHAGCRLMCAAFDPDKKYCHMIWHKSSSHPELLLQFVTVYRCWISEMIKLC